MYTIEGDGTQPYTKVYKDGKELQFDRLMIKIDKDSYIADVDGVVDVINKIIINGVYKIIGFGTFVNTRLFHLEEVMRGVQSVVVVIKKDEHPRILINAVLLPHILEEDK